MTIRAELKDRNLFDTVSTIAKRHGVTIEEMWSDSHMPGIAAARHEFWAELKATGRWSWARIGKLARRDPTSVIAGVRKAVLRGMKGEAA